ncbi:unnamed protein product, partial [Larinioides sclopetarius]
EILNADNNNEISPTSSLRCILSEEILSNRKFFVPPLGKAAGHYYYCWHNSRPMIKTKKNLPATAEPKDF